MELASGSGRAPEGSATRATAWRASIAKHPSATALTPAVMPPCCSSYPISIYPDQPRFTIALGCSFECALGRVLNLHRETYMLRYVTISNSIDVLCDHSSHEHAFDVWGGRRRTIQGRSCNLHGADEGLHTAGGRIEDVRVRVMGRNEMYRV